MCWPAAGNTSCPSHSYSVGMTLSELRLLCITQYPDTTLACVSLENDISMTICASNNTPTVMTQREKEAGAE